MPKYFNDERKLPFPKIQLCGPGVTERGLEEVLTKAEAGVSLCACYDEFPESCLGYVFNIKKQGGRYVLIDIVGKDVLLIESLEDLCSVINHVMGTKYSDKWQAVFQKRRNEIGLADAQGED